jgi:hypothetical protein
MYLPFHPFYLIKKGGFAQIENSSISKLVQSCKLLRKAFLFKEKIINSLEDGKF